MGIVITKHASVISKHRLNSKSGNRLSPGQRHKPKSSSSDILLKIGIVCAAIVVIAAVMGIMSACSKKRANAAIKGQQVASAQQAAAFAPREVRYDELGGKTMQEWCKDNDKKNPDLQARKKRINTQDRARADVERRIRRGEQVESL